MFGGFTDGICIVGIGVGSSVGCCVWDFEGTIVEFLVDDGDDVSEGLGLGEGVRDVDNVGFGLNFVSPTKSL